MKQGELFERPKRRRRRTWTELDRARRRLQRLERLFMEGSANQKQIDELPRAREALANEEKKAREKWKNCFGS
jgi:hypothetical protein